MTVQLANAGNLRARTRIAPPTGEKQRQQCKFSRILEIKNFHTSLEAGTSLVTALGVALDGRDVEKASFRLEILASTIRRALQLKSHIRHSFGSSKW